MIITANYINSVNIEVDNKFRILTDEMFRQSDEYRPLFEEFIKEFSHEDLLNVCDYESGEILAEP